MARYMPGLARVLLGRIKNTNVVRQSIFFENWSMYGKYMNEVQGYSTLLTCRVHSKM